jgi:hypothetical protein
MAIVSDWNTYSTTHLASPRMFRDVNNATQYHETHNVWWCCFHNKTRGLEDERRKHAELEHKTRPKESNQERGEEIGSQSWKAGQKGKQADSLALGGRSIRGLSTYGRFGRALADGTTQAGAIKGIIDEQKAIVPWLTTDIVNNFRQRQWKDL